MNYALLAVARQSRSKRAPFPLNDPLRRERWRHCFALQAKRREFKFDIFKVRVSVTQICKFNFKFERKTIRRSIFVLDEALFKFGDGSYLVGNDRAKFKSNEV